MQSRRLPRAGAACRSARRSGRGVTPPSATRACNFRKGHFPAAQGKPSRTSSSCSTRVANTLCHARPGTGHPGTTTQVLGGPCLPGVLHREVCGMQEEEDALLSTPSLSSRCLVPSMVTSWVTAPTTRQLCLMALCCAALPAAENTETQGKKGSLTRREGARRAPTATAAG